MQSPVQTPAPDPTEHSYVFGRHEPTDARASVFGSEPQSYAAQQNYTAQQNYATQQSYAAPQNYSAPAKPAYAPVSTVQSERPMVFMLRDDPNMFVYEYTDRLEYFRRTDVGMVHCATKYKAKKY
ncbi:MAG: hypothetical protein K2M48_01355, partial [Clostridiales bacterium]|nr:hypothetical protein [Clostridiales bacterium]